MSRASKLSIRTKNMRVMANDLSIYIHWPFCLSKCPYCDFNSHVVSTIDYNQWLKSYEKEIEYFKFIIQNKYIKSIFFGGGTPSLMQPLIVEVIINKINNLGIIDNKTEITLETNPTSFETEKLKAFKSAGINRVSIGVQSLKEDDLKKLGRTHDSMQAIKTIEAANTIVPRVSFDLIYARNGQTLKDWEKELKQAMYLATSHIALYQLTIEKGTPFYKLFKNGNLILPTSDEAAEMYEWTNHYLESKKYFRYEISNYARLGHECLHNLTYWNYNSYLGIGPGAHSRIIENSNSVLAIMMLHNPAQWLDAVSTKNVGIQTHSKLTNKEIIEEILMMGLRLRKGIKISTLEQRLSTALENILDINNLQHYQNQGLIKLDEHIYLTDKGLMLHNYIVPRLIR
ncbi:coproporphyrinogen III oxidase [Rickettsia prowazekii str. GvV257]|uniref:radical SAM family heme chaperone HemW n=1 Tax=Rickettsia prowazekii TaxID=782 RepID=UPI000256C649|nr:radical SAM family heme chaperone HemW [Rickettsia prowazekii]AFE52622.1 coproporphyrinogen III oxidase [Rickettsia prowazekii str. GvV257]AFE53193.1 coproporphyrinogen III oxidase [Rickettsia prowazekii str. RpGvF24]